MRLWGLREPHRKKAEILNKEQVYVTHGSRCAGGSVYGRNKCSQKTTTDHLSLSHLRRNLSQEPHPGLPLLAPGTASPTNHTYLFVFLPSSAYTHLIRLPPIHRLPFKFFQGASKDSDHLPCPLMPANI